MGWGWNGLLERWTESLIECVGLQMGFVIDSVNVDNLVDH